MPERWSAGSVLALAPDASAGRSAKGLATPARWTGTGATGDAVWGLCQGSGPHPYQTVIDLSGPAYTCSCPSRKFPCKHALALLLLWSVGTVPDAASPADFAGSWLEARRKRQQSSASRTPSAVSPGSASSSPVAKDQDAAAKRAAQRAERVSGGLAELTEWLRDQVRVGLAASARGGSLSAVAARMVDAQAKGVAGTLRGLAGIVASRNGAAGDAWPGRLLSEYALLHLLARAHERIDDLPEGLAATVRSRIGYTTTRQQVLAGPPVADQWEVLGVRELEDGDVPGRRVWVRGTQTRRFAMLLTFAAGPAGWSDPAIARLRPGSGFRADLHFYPGDPPLRAVPGTWHTEPARSKPPVPDAGPDGGIDAMLAGYAAGLAQDPWLTVWPALLDVTPVSPDGAVSPNAPNAPPGGATTPGSTAWHLADQAGTAVPLTGTASLWTLLAVSGGRPVTVAGEWHPDGLLPLTVWLDDQAVAL
ncbi:MAG TPA: SWIM zinc finger family protein [Trebonia sp.]|nr:SWIM zinc finger family protein [Trebonia sp.]